MKLSVCMIVRNEEHCLARALHSIKDLADEIIVVDTGSADRTTTIAREYTKNVYDLAWHDDFSEARNFSLSKATGDWVLVIDADEVIAPEDHALMRSLLAQPAVAYAFQQVSYTNDTTQYHYIPLVGNLRYQKYAHSFSGYISCNIIRLFRNHRNIRFAGAVHESVDASCKEQGDVVKTDVWIHHYQFERGADALREKQLYYLKIYEDHLDEYPDKARAYRDIASIYYTYTTHYDRAINYFQKSLALNNNNKKIYAGLGLCYIKQQNFHDALLIFEKGLEMFPGDTHLLHLKQFATQRQKDL